MFTKETLKKEFSRDWKKHYQLEIFKERGFTRKTCRTCKKHFWTLDKRRSNCGDPPCQKYEFIGKPITKLKLDYIQTWKVFEKFFTKNSHESIPRYPVIDRWRPDLFFTMASIQDFQRIDQGNMVFEYPTTNLVVPQMCLRFNDIPNVGVTGRHHTSFIMSGQHSFGGYWKDKCIELNFRFLTEVLGIPDDELTYKEDIWSMPDFSAFGPCIETFSRGLELVNSVFMQFTKSGSSYRELPLKVIDVGWGHERLSWFSQGTPTGYDAVFEPVINWMKKQTGLHQDHLFNEYAKLSGNLNFDEAENLKKARQSIARSLGLSDKELHSLIEPMQALYAIADHTKTLLFAASDAGIPSNTGGGYNLRVLLRRALSFLKEFNFQIELEKVASLHARHLNPLFPELSVSLDLFSKIIGVETERYNNTLHRAGNIVHRELKKGKISPETLQKLYISNGIPPEMIEKEAKKQGTPFEIPADFYVNITDKHMVGEKEQEEGVKLDTTGIEKTDLLYYKTPYDREFEAVVLKRIGDWIILDKTMFYPEGGGQPGDLGHIVSGHKQYPVTNVQKIGDVIIHKVDGIRANEIVKGVINWEHRHQLMKMHTATHIVAGSVRKVIGPHTWQAGAQKGLESSRIDLTHYQPFSREEIRKIERLANQVVSRKETVTSVFMPRKEAEGRYGFILYQGGTSPGKEIRVINVADGFDVEGCGGTHLKNTGEIELIKIIRTERIQDGVNRIELTAGKPAFRYLDDLEKITKETISKFKVLDLHGRLTLNLRPEEDTSKDVLEAAEVFSVEPKNLPKTMERFCREILEDHLSLNKSREKLNIPKKTLEQESYLPHSHPKHLKELSKTVFSVWKNQKKEIDRLNENLAKEKSEKLISRAKNSRIFEVIPGTRKELIDTASLLLKKNPKLTVILANQSGDIIGMSNREDVGNEISEICQKAGGSGGGSPTLGQGRVELSKLLKVMGQQSE